MARPRGGNSRRRGAGLSNQAIAQRFASGLVALRIIEAVTAIVVLAMLVHGVMTQQYLFALPAVIIGLVFLASTALGIRMQRQMAAEEATERRAAERRARSSFADIVAQAQADRYLEAYNEAVRDNAVERS